MSIATWRPASEVHIKINCHPERNLARLLRQMESKDLRLHFGTYAMHFWDTTLAQSLRG
jgi:hypothetical protein